MFIKIFKKSQQLCMQDMSEVGIETTENYITVTNVKKDYKYDE